MEIERFLTLTGALAVVLSLQGRIVRANAALCSLVGYQERDLIDRDVVSLVHPEERNMVQQVLQERTAIALQSNLPVRLVRHNGEVLDTVWGGTLDPEHQFIFAVGHDVTRLITRRNQNADRRRRERLKILNRAESARALRAGSLADSVSEGVVALSKNHRLSMVNKVAARLLNLQPPYAGRPPREVGLPESLVSALQSVLSDPESGARVIQLEAARGRIEASVTALPSGAGQRWGAVAVLRPERSQVRSASDEYLAGMSHELRAPLSALSAMIEAINDGLVHDERRPRYLKLALAEVERLRRLTNELIELARLESGTAEFDTASFDVPALLQTVADSWQPRCRVAGLRLWSESSPLWAVGDLERVRQVLERLLANAVRFSQAGGSIMLSAAAEGQQIRIRVADTGIGIEQEQQPYVWDRFFMADQARTRRGDSGTGLGLSFVKTLVEAMHGTVAVQSSPGNGSVFSFTLPTAPAQGTKR